ncbi:pilus assembly protein [Vibrio lentus]|uniref:type II secretion system F family protein n=1 Tax=Vibrio lentus TaxID=136468 RepID=UPI000C840561|nr:type II secretion system F family protein [Vibrio lentus]MCC4816015.1 type II secretion system F family protein [Vibrio lentus]PMG67781.1 pilus assembly protein [Vibrio lentus]PMK86552.1 pilus assembly protein [Vibrio lentus]PML21070.1 pilus assembly protein [Vibrio lentus]PMM23788.1 pilus assembly protein [Vibrio lentus]
MMYVALLLLGCALLLTVVAHFSSFKRDVVAERLTHVSSYSSKYTITSSKWRFQGAKPRRQKLILIGWLSPNAEIYFLGLRLLTMVTGSIAWYVTRIQVLNMNSVAECIAIAIVVGILFDRILDWRVNQVRMQISRVIPDAVDLMVVCVASGLTLEAVFRCVGEEMRAISPALSREWLLTATEISVLDSPQTALSNLDKRVQLPDINNIVTTMNQALQYGTPLAEALKLIASDSRQYHFLELEEWVGKIPAKMSFPLVVFIMLPVVGIIVVPIMLSLKQTLGGL